MKNIYGLANAMKVVESACEKGEITIIGEGATPSAIGLYDKCVAYINKMYGVDILNLVIKKAAEPAPKVEECKIGLLFDLDEIECSSMMNFPSTFPSSIVICLKSWQVILSSIVKTETNAME